MTTRSLRWSLRSVFSVVWAFGIVMSTSLAHAQSAASGTIHGTVRDETGAALPGVTATLSSPALQIAQIIQVTGADGNYRFVELPAGIYRVTYELTGFNTFVRDDLRLSVGFAARVDVTLPVGRVEESVTVSGQSPVVDVSSTSTTANFTQETLDTVPRGRDLWAVVAMTPGVALAGAPDVGGSRMGERSSMETFGVGAQPKLEVEGINITTGPDENSSVYFNYFGFDEIQFKTSGTDAEVGVPGLQMLAVLKSGGNQFHGQYQGSYEGPKLQSDNLNAALRAQGLSNTEPLKYHYDVAADLGGRIVRDKLWFYAGYNRQQRVSSPLGFVVDPGADGRYLTGDEPLADYRNTLGGYNAKLSWQASQNHKFIGVYQKGTKLQPQNGAGRFRPLSATRDYVAPTWVKKGELQSTLGSRVLIDVVGGDGGAMFDYSAMRTPFYQPESPSRLDRETGLRTGGHEASDQRPRGKAQIDGGVSFFPERFFGGRHEMKTGATVYWFRHATGRLDHPHGNYVLVYDRVGGLSGQPVEVQVNNSPLYPKNRQTTYAWYLKDTWRVTDRLTANLGIRWERQKSWLPAQSIKASPGFPTLFPSGSFDPLDVLTWMRVLPRAGLAWALNSKTVVKTSFGLYNYLVGDDFAGNYNGNALVNATFRWTDPNKNGNYDPGEVNLNPNGPDFLSITGAANNILPRELKQPMTTEATASISRELRENLALRVVYVFRRLEDFFDIPGPNVLRPREVYNIPITRRDPGPDGVLRTADDGGSVTFYDYDPVYRGAAFVGNKVTNSPNIDRYQTVEVALTKRYSRRWNAEASFWVVKNHRWVTRTFDGPNTDFFPLDQTWEWASNASGSYRLPWGIQLAAFLQSKTGVLGQRTYIFRAVDPDGGPRLNQLSTVTLRLEPYGARKGPAINLVNLRASREVSLPDGRRFGIDVDLFNVLNSSAPTAMTFAQGPTFGYATSVLPGRIARFGLKFSF
jgi:hypothetical protein